MRLLVIAFALGTLALQHAAQLPDAGVGLWGLAALLATCVVRSRMLLVVLVCAGGFASGFGYAAWRAQVRLADELPRAWEGRDIAVVARVASLPQVSEWGARFVVEV